MYAYPRLERLHHPKRESELANLIVVGAGTVGSELRRQLEASGHTIVAQATRRWVETLDERHAFEQPLSTRALCDTLGHIVKTAQAGMIAIPNADRGGDEIEWLDFFRNKNDLPVVTCAKAAHAYRFEFVNQCGGAEGKIGNSASVGGGSDILHALQRFQLARQNLIVYAVINGTLNYIWSSVQVGQSFGAAVEAAKKMGYAEPGNTDHVSIVNGELGDICMKAAIICNTALSDGKRFITPDDFHVWKLHASDINYLTSRNARFRYVVTFASVDDPDEVEKNTPGYIEAKFGGWQITGGFHDVKAETPFYDWLRQIDGVNNGFTIHNPLSGNTGQNAAGPGAGPEVTAAAMVRDLNRLLAAR